MFDIDLIQRKIKQFIVNYFGVRKHMLSGELGDGFSNKSNQVHLQSNCEYLNNAIQYHSRRSPDSTMWMIISLILIIGATIQSMIFWLFVPLIFATVEVENNILEFRGASTHDISAMLSDYTIKDYIKTLKILEPEKDIKELERIMYKIKNEAERSLKGE